MLDCIPDRSRCRSSKLRSFQGEIRNMVRNIRGQHVSLVMNCISLGMILAALTGCQGLPKNVANCPTTPTAPANTSIVPPAPEPPAAALCGFPLSITSPANGASVNSPVPILAIATPPDPIYTVRLYVDGLAVLYSPNTTLNQLIWMPNGQHTVEVVAEDTAGYVATTSMQVNVINQAPGALNLQDHPDWVSCSAVIAGSTCAAGLGVAASTLALHQSTPSLDGSAAKFSLAGNHAYSTNSIGHQSAGETASATLRTTFTSTSTAATRLNHWNSM